MLPGIAELEPAKKQSLDRIAADSLREAVISGRIPAGARLTEVQLAEQFALSRGTVRTALQRLVAEGLVVQQPYARWEVTTLTAHDVWELATLRSSLEGLAGRLAAERIDDAGREILLAAFHALEDAARQEQKDLASVDLELHRTVVSLSGNRRLIHHYSLITNQLRLYIASSNQIVGAEGGLLDRHLRLVEPILAGDGDAAEQAFKDLFSRSARELVDFLKSARQEEAGHQQPRDH
ncbi:hypothetical protein WN73_14705 [Bradyrhizobium sp. CCBAU 45394]|uniref:GntR family transcriptional regulator n=1 Tax=Bradyrhizobium TaxID=374 RepID=UPI0015CEF60B|nr:MULTISPECIES: GntR family transcriptional regulator [Bradyrhizobium]MDA9391844.1 hypothetical protein [Bradyrhizobium sp. CCBAU 45394]MDA9503914.1 hypothetical protein [Bradyrhizobium sp. CCBAU 11386]